VTAIEHALVLAYLDPVSWLAAAQLLGGLGAWVALRARRLSRRGRAASSGLTRVSASEASKELAVEDPSRPRLVVVLEGPRDWPYLEPYLKALTSEAIDADLWIVSAGDLPDVGVAELGASARVVADLSSREWRRLVSGIAHATVLTTLTDLGDPMFPRSTGRVRYIYAFHSLVSTHVAYREAAFDAYDVVLSPSPQHSEELRTRERLAGTPHKVIEEVGYAYLDELTKRGGGPASTTKSVLIAPSWASDQHYLTTWLQAAHAFAGRGWQVILRPHPETLKRSRAILSAVELAIAGNAAIRIDRSALKGGLLPAAAALVSDWSGAAIEFALATGQPVAFVDTPRKMRNARWQTVREGSVELDLRHRAGLVVAPHEVGRLPDLLGERLAAEREAAPALVYNPDQSAIHGARVILASLRDEPG